MRVGVAVSTKFDDMEQVRARLTAGAAREDTTLVMLPKDRVVASLLTEIGAERVETYATAHDYTRDAVRNQFLNSVDHMLVFHRPGSTTTDYFVRKARDWIYAPSYADKTTIVEIGESKKKRATGRSKAE